MSADACISALIERFAAIDFAPAPLNASPVSLAPQMRIHLSPDRLLEVMRFLRDDPRTQLDLLSDLTCVDYLEYPDAQDRFGITYNLLSTTHNHRLFARCLVNDPDPSVPSVTDIWRGAEWLEREVFDMFGIRFDQHPDLRRILTWDGFKAHPLRKDYPLKGRGEREDFKIVGREMA